MSYTSEAHGGPPSKGTDERFLYDMQDAAGAFSMMLVFRRPPAGAGGSGEITGACNLPLPNILQEAFNISYKKADVTMTAFVADILSKTMNEFGGIERLRDNTSENRGQDLAQAFANQVTQTLNSLTMEGAGATAAAFAEGALGSGPALGGFLFNPHMANIYDGTRPRDFTFSWKSYPKDKTEAQLLMNCIHLIKKKISPPVAGTFGPMEIIRYPDVVDIEILIGGQTGYFPVKQCVVTNFQVDYGASGVMSFFNDAKPTSVSFSMSVTETKSMTREDVEAMPTFGAQ